MAELLMRMGQFDKAEKTIALALEHETKNTDASDISSMVMQAKLLNLQSKVFLYSSISFNTMVSFLK